MSNRLSAATSPYLRQHAENPVDWWPWCDEAFAAARERDVPVLLSVGYAACHWCHVMAHESFEDPRTADLMNERFVAIKVDREERPDIDAVYMAATQVLTGSGGWPMTVLLDQDGHAFFAGTYFPPVARPGMPSFTQLLVALDEAWRTDRARVATAASRLHETLSRQTVPTAGGTAPTRADVAGAVGALARDFDTDRGGFGRAPKFPPSPVLEFLLRAHALGAGSAPEAPALRMAADTMTAMARGGIYDQLGGGFARYSVDADWVVPHFEKMLYDNAQLLRCYLHWWRATGDPLARRVAEETARFLLAELRTAQGGFASSLDADSGGREGAFYAWTPAELEQALGPADAEWVARLCGVTTAGTFEAGASVLQLRADPPDPARWQRCRAALAAARGTREHPARDDKVVAAWNGLAIAGLAEAGALLDLPELVDAATRCAEHLRAVHWGPDRRLVRVSLAGQVNPDAGGVLEDYADLAEGLLALYQVTGDERWYRWSGELLDVVLEQFGDGRAGFFDTASDAPALVRRPQDPTDGVAASGWSAAVQALVTFAALSGETRFRDSAERANATLLALAQRNPRFTGWTWAAMTSVLAGPVQVAIVFPEPDRTGPHAGPSLRERPQRHHETATSGPSTADLGSGGSVPFDARGHDLLLAALSSTSPGLVVATGVEGRSEVPLLHDRPSADGVPTAYPCRGFVCDLPVTSVEDLKGSIVR